MTIIDITKDYLELFTAKRKIEEKLLNENKISEEFTVSDFIKYINFGTHIYWVSETQIYPFKIIDDFLFIVTDSNTKTINPLLNALNTINFDLSKLTHKTKYDIAVNDIIEKPHFIINSELYYYDTN